MWRKRDTNQNHDVLCPSCGEEADTCAHVLHCEEKGRVDALVGSIKSPDEWLASVGTEGTIRRCLVRFAKNRQNVRMENIHSLGRREKV